MIYNYVNEVKDRDNRKIKERIGYNNKISNHFLQFRELSSLLLLTKFPQV
jgi:hypothetical protein